MTAALCILKGLRSKIELARAYRNRLTKHFPNLKIIILTGRAGAGKTHVMKEIFYGLNLDQHVEEGMTAAEWLDGAATVAGRREKLKTNPHGIVFWNEIQCGDIHDVRLMKQISEGLISYYKYGDLEETKFTGLLVGSTNDFSAKGKVGRDLEALRDRIDLVEVGAPDGYAPHLAIEDETHYLKRANAEVDWAEIADGLVNDSEETLTSAERDMIRPFWLAKIRECLDGRILTRAGWDFLDCFTFCKRFFREYGGLADEYVFDAAVRLAYESVVLNPIAMSSLTITQKDIVETISIAPDKTCVVADLKTALEKRGRFISTRTMHRSINRLIESGLLLRHRHGEYSLLTPKPEVVEHGEFHVLLEELSEDGDH
jgi:hypothetical protein